MDMKRVPYLLVLIALFAAGTIVAQQQQSNTNKTAPSKQAAPPKQSAPAPIPKIHNVNPTGDRKVGEGYGKAQQENRKKRHTDQRMPVASTRG
jgi:hypothetical protein